MTRAARARAGFALLELALTLGLIGLLIALVVPRLGVIGSAALDSSARRLATRIQFLREEAALRSGWIRLAIDPESGSFRAERLVPVAGGAEFVPEDGPLYRATTLPSPMRLTLEGPAVTTTPDGFRTTVFSPDGYADPAIVWLDDGAGRRVAIVIEPVASRPRVLDEADVPTSLASGMGMRG
ncbi:MAG: hypothetical protein FJ144_18840 [Deltaproteobacteria bacterium]|nr:hypothetical protein [Deltaproteobacteria bacterium]